MHIKHKKLRENILNALQHNEQRIILINNKPKKTKEQFVYMMRLRQIAISLIKKHKLKYKVKTEKYDVLVYKK